MRIKTRIGDTIKTVKPMNCDSPMFRAGEYLHVKLANQASCIEADELIKTGRWEIVAEREEGAA